MSEPKLISPLLDGYAMGAALSNHDGVQCCPAMKENSDNKYIVKIISVPASQVQLEALLLTGAYKDPAQAMDYFKELTDGIVKEAEFLKKVSKLEGFLPYEGWQVVPMEDNQLGYHVYLIGSYKQSLDKFTRKNLMTHLGAVNLGLDMCAALAICRRAGRIYVDLKPANIFISDDKEYRIGDLGFIDLKSLKYAGLPTKYQSPYTAPELLDPMATLNTTVDIYAAGMILYQIYNNGKLPYEGNATAEVFPTPENADYEIAEIIMKAIAPDPNDRWQSPIEMGQALVAYMQRNTVNDVPIAPPAASVTPAEPPIQQAAPEAESAADTSEVPAEEPQDAPAPEETDFMDDMDADETAPGEEDADESDEQGLSDEITSMLAQANELISHEAPEPAVAPELVDVGIPTPEAAAADTPAAPTAPAKDSPDAPLTDDDIHFEILDDGEPTPEENESDDEELEEDDESSPKKKRGWLAALIVGIVLALLAAGGFLFYKYYYQLPIDSLHVDPFENQVTVVVDTDVDTSLLTVVCTDIYGNTQRLPLTNGQAVFTDLLPDTQYKIQLETSGFHALVGSTSSSFSTDAVTNILNFTAATGNEDGSVVLNFTIEGPGTEDWSITYSTEGEEPQIMSFTGHMVTISGLTVGKTYTFELQPAAELYMTGENTLEFTASAIILAEHLTITDCTDGNLTVEWKTPEGAQVDSWTVRCYTDEGYSETVETNDTTVTFSGIDATKAHTVEVTASGMTQSVRTNMSADPTTITSVNFDESDVSKLVISWEYNGATPENGWLLLYSYDGIEKQEVIRCDEPRAEIIPRIPGATYNIVIQSASGTSIFGNIHSHTCAAAAKFTDYDILVDYSTFNLCVTPSNENWKYSDVDKSDYTTTFAIGDKVSMIIKSSSHFLPKDKISILYVIRDENGSVITELTSLEEDVSWYNMWQGRYPYTTLDIPNMPKTAGSYTLDLYWNYQAVTSIDFTITE